MSPCDECLTPRRCRERGCARRILERDVWLAGNSEAIAEVLRFASITIDQMTGIATYRHEARDRARIKAIEEILGRYRALVADAVEMAPVRLPLASDEVDQAVKVSGMAPEVREMFEVQRNRQKYGTCRACKGNGWRFGGWIKCGICGGSGVVAIKGETR